MFEEKASSLIEQPKLFKAGRVKNTREAVVHPNYVLVYEVAGSTVTILRVLHTSQAWPAAKKTSVAKS
ncbi:MAG: type II toxin-antitoxin system RelE/ParE family toxin [Pseudomonadota bacterium]